MESVSKVIVFRLKDQQYGIEIQQVLSIERVQDITIVPQMSSFIKGIINLRNQIIPIVDLQERMNLGGIIETEETRNLIVDVDGMQVGLVVDAATDVMDIDSTIIDPVPQVAGEVGTTFIKGVAKLEDKLLILLDVADLFTAEEMIEVQQVLDSI